MPKMSMTMETGEVVGWSVSVGDTIAAGDVVCEVHTDKVDMEVESPPSTAPSSRSIVESGMVDVGAPIGWVEGEDDWRLRRPAGRPPA